MLSCKRQRYVFFFFDISYLNVRRVRKVTEGDSSEGDVHDEDAPNREELDDSSLVERLPTDLSISEPSSPVYGVISKKQEEPEAQPAERPFCVHISSSQDLLDESPIDKVVPPAAVVEPDVTIIDASELHTATPGEMKFLRIISQLDAAFPPPLRGEFQPSEFQRAVLDDMKRKRQKFGHKHGLSIMATAVGKVRLRINA